MAARDGSEAGSIVSSGVGILHSVGAMERGEKLGISGNASDLRSKR